MANETRKKIRRSLDYAVKDIEAAQQLLSREGLLFENVHPEKFLGFQAAVMLLEESRKLVTRLHESI